MIVLLAALGCYAYFALPQFSGSKRQLQACSAKTAPHLSILFCILVACWGWGFYLDRFELLYSTQGVVYGAGYTAVHVTRTAFGIMIGAAAVLCALSVLNIFIAEASGTEPQLPALVRESVLALRRSPILAGRIREPGDGAAFFVW